MSQKLSVTYKEKFAEWWQQEMAKPENKGLLPSPYLVEKFAEWLDSFQTLTPELQVLAMQKAREIDRELLLLLIDEVGVERARELAKIVNDRHKHTDIDNDGEDEPPEGSAPVPA